MDQPDYFNHSNDSLEVSMPHSKDAEYTIIGNLILRNGLVSEAVEWLKPEDFYVPSCRKIYEAILALFERGSPIDPLLIAEELKKDNALESVGGIRYITDSTYGLPQANSIKHYAKIIKGKALLRRLIIANNKSTAEAFAQEEEPEVIVNKSVKAGFDLTLDSKVKSFTRIDTLNHASLTKAYEIQKSGKSLTGIPSGFADLDALTLGFQKKDLIILAGRPSMGKAQPLDSLILKRNGEWTEMQYIQLGDKLASPDGILSEVEAIFPQGQRDIYKITFSDGRSAEADAEHYWQIQSRRFGPKLFTTKELYLYLKNKRWRLNLSIEPPLIEFDKKDLPIKPWLLGALIGDGGLSGRGSVSFSSVDKQMIDMVSEELDDRLEIRHGKDCNYRIAVKKRLIDKKGNFIKSNVLALELNKLGLIGKRSEFKTIPDIYLKSCYADRLALLQGLLDTDGTAEKFGSISFGSTSKELAYQVVDLARSIGCIAKIRHAAKQTGYRAKGSKEDKKICLPFWVVYIAKKDAEILFRLERKKIRVIRKRAVPRLSISKIEYTRTFEAQCIKVSHPKGLYITNEYITTHNTASAVCMAVNAAKLGYRVGYFSLEQPDDQISNRVLCTEARMDLRKYRGGYINHEEWERLGQAHEALRGKHLYIEDTPAINYVTIKAKAMRLIVEHGPLDIIYVDYIGLMENVEGKKHFSREQEVAQQPKGLRRIAQELDVAMVALSQLNRGPENRTDHRPTLADLRESGALEQDADVVAFIYRADQYRPRDEPRDNTAELILAKQRNGPTDIVRLRFDAPSTRFDNLA